MNPEDIRRYGHMLYQAMQSRQSVRPLTEQAPDISIDDAYQISLQFLQHRLDAGERIVGKKIGTLGQQRVVGVDRAHHLQGMLAGDRITETLAGGAFIVRTHDSPLSVAPPGK